MSLKMICAECGAAFDMFGIPVMDGEQPCICCARCGAVYSRCEDDLISKNEG